MRILIINYYYAPAIDAHAYRWTQISQLWASQGLDVEVITSRIRGIPSNSIESGVKICRTGLTSRSTSTNTSQTKKTRRSEIKSKVIEFLRPAYRRIYWPDALWHWFPFALLALLQRRNEKYDLVISYYPSYSAHLAALIFKKISAKSNFKWILDYGDPFCTSESWQPNNYEIYNKLNKYIELNCSNHGEMIFTNTETAIAYKKKLSIQKEFKVIAHIGDIQKFYTRTKLNPSPKNKPIKLCYIGAFHPNIREPHRLFKLIKKLIKIHKIDIQLNIYGPNNGFNLSPSDCPQIKHYGYIQRDNAIEVMKSVDFIITIDNENCIMTPSKNVECIATGRPIINIANPSVSYEPMNNYMKAGYALSVMDKDISDAAVSEVHTFILKHHGSAPAPFEAIQKILGAHLLENVAAAYLS